MSLQIWMPMTLEPTLQQGLSGVKVFENGEVLSYSGGGKLGMNCCNFSSSGGNLNIPAEAMSNFVASNGCSLAFWLKINSWNTSYETYFQAGTGSTPWNNYIFGILRNATNSTVCFTIGNGSSASNNSYLTSALTTGVWMHLAFTYETGKCKIYLNGNLDKEYITSIVPDFSKITKITVGRCNNDSSYQTNCNMNDLRIYDHCLSPKEVKKIAQGLILHYPLNQNSTYMSLIDKTTNYNIYNNFGSDVTYSLVNTNKQFMNSPVKRLTATINNSSRINSFKTELWSHGVYGWSRTFSANTKYCFWIYYKPITHTDIRVGGTASNISGWTEIPPKYVGDGWYRVGQYRNGSVTTDKTDNIFVSFTWTSATTNTPVSIDFACPTLIQGLTEIQPLINYEGRPDKIEDCSGYNNYGTALDILHITTDSSKYLASTQFDSTSSKIALPYMDFSGMANSYTFSWWQYNVSTGNMPWGFSNGNRLNCYHCSPLCWNTGDGGTNQFKDGSTTISPSSLQNAWHHMAITGDGTNTKLYIDGVYRGTAITYKPLTGTHIWISGWDSSTSYTFNGSKESDFRIYATALSANDIKELYAAGRP